MAKQRSMSRRAAIKTIGAAATACGLAARAQAQTYHPQAQTQLTQTAARYQDKPHDGQICAACPYFVQPASCVLVEGKISPTGWCPMFTTFQPLDRGAHA